MAKRTTKTANRSRDEDAPAPAKPAPKRAAAKKPAPKKAAPKRAAPRAKAEAPRAPRRPSRIGTALRDQANKLLARADDEAVKAILTAGALAAAAVFLGDKAADQFKDEDGPGGSGGGSAFDTPAGRARLKAAAAAGGTAMGAQLLKTLEQTRERKGLAGADEGFDPKALAVKAVAAFIK